MLFLAVIEASFLIFPVILYWVILYFLGKDDDIQMLPAWSFLSLSIYSLLLRDVVKTYNRNDAKDNYNKTGSTIVCIVGISLSSALLSLSITRSKITEIIFPYTFEVLVFILIVIGFLLAVIARYTLLSREKDDK